MATTLRDLLVEHKAVLETKRKQAHRDVDDVFNDLLRKADEQIRALAEAEESTIN